MWWIRTWASKSGCMRSAGGCTAGLLEVALEIAGALCPRKRGAPKARILRQFACGGQSMFGRKSASSQRLHTKIF